MVVSCDDSGYEVKVRSFVIVDLGRPKHSLSLSKVQRFSLYLGLVEVSKRPFTQK